MTTLDGNLPPVLGDRDPKGPPDNRPPTKPPTQPNYPPPPPPPSKGLSGVMHGWLIPEDLEMPEFFSRHRYPKAPKAPKLPRNAHGSCMVGELLVPLFGHSWVDEVTRRGGLVPYLVRRLLAAVFPARSPEAYR